MKKNEPLAKHTTLGVGGKARYFATITNDIHLTTLNSWLIQHKERLEFFNLGGGSNVLFSDKGFDGLIIKNKIKIFSYSGSAWRIGAGNLMSEIVALAANNGIAGFEWAAGLPGTVGGAIYGNAGCYGGQMWDCLESVRYFELNDATGRPLEVRTEPYMFSYRQSIFKSKPQNIIISATLKISKNPRNIAAVQSKTKSIHEERQKNNPKERSIGCIFKNPTAIPKGEKELKSAGWLIEKAGLKGLCYGSSSISTVHANFFVNDFRGLSNLGLVLPANDMIELIKIAKGRVYEKFGILLEEEIIRVGEF
ncbi:MAG: UDP-N-acetylmuramate dehydrogenase [bacterium]|nr:UDP-N-acetylmuramate dehydrogenase [bacterium]